MKQKLLLIAILVFSLSLFVVACGKTSSGDIHTHEYVWSFVAGSEPTEDADGKAQGVCACGEKTNAYVAKLTDTSVWSVEVTAATCSTKGAKTYASKFGTVVVDIPVDAAAHKLVDVAAVAHTCTEAGTVAYKHCEICEKNFDADGNVLDSIVNAADPAAHDLEDVAAVAHTCTEDGVIAHKHCKVCLKNFDASGEELASVADPAAHLNVVQDKAVAATCTTTGKTAGSHCSVCNTVIIAQENIPAKGHTPVAVNGKAATCTEDGLTDGEKCSVCDAVIVAQEIIPAAHIQVVIDAAVEATCTTAGKTEGSHCETCGAVIIAQEDVPAKGHSFDEYGECSDCGAAVFANMKFGVVQSANDTVSSKTSWVLSFVEGVAVDTVLKPNQSSDYLYCDGSGCTENIKDSIITVRFIDKVKGLIEVKHTYVDEIKHSWCYEDDSAETITTVYTGYFDAATKTIVAINGSKVSWAYIFIPSDTAIDANAVDASDMLRDGYNAKALTYNGVNVFIENGAATIGVDFVDLNGNALTPEKLNEAARTPAFRVLKGGALVSSFGYINGSVVKLDGLEGAYSADSYAFTLDGAGTITIGANKGTYVIDDEKVLASIKNEAGEIIAYYEITLGENKTATVVAPTVTLTYSNAGSTEPVDVNKNASVALKIVTPDEQDFDGVAKKFCGWQAADGTVIAAGEKVVLTADATYTAVWKTIYTITLTDARGILGESGITVKALDGQTVEEALADLIANGYIANGKTYEIADFTYEGTAVDKATVIEEDVSLVVVWKGIVTLTVKYDTIDEIIDGEVTYNYTNGIADKVTEYFKGNVADPEVIDFITATATVNGEVKTATFTFAGWATEDGADYVPGEISADTVIKAKWVMSAVPFYGAHKGFYVYGSSSSNSITTGTVQDLTVKTDGTATQSYRYSDITEYNYEDGTFKFDGYNGIYNAENETIVLYKTSTSGSDVKYTCYFYFKNATDVAYVKKGTTILGGYFAYANVVVASVKYTVNEVEKTTNVALIGGKLYTDVTVKVLGAEFTEFNKIGSQGDVEIFKGETSLALYVKNGYNLVTKVDSLRGIYTATTGETLYVNGGSKLYVTVGEKTNEYDYTIVDEETGLIESKISGVLNRITLNKENHTAVIVKPTATIIFNLSGKGDDIVKVVEISYLNFNSIKPTAEGFKLVGWFTKSEADGWGSQAYGLTPDVDSVNTYYAKWTPAATVTFHDGDDVYKTVTTYYVGDSVSSSDIETLKDETNARKFDGWYTKDGSVDGDWGSKVSSSTKVADVTVNFYAKWLPAVQVNVYDGETLVKSFENVKYLGESANWDMVNCKPDTIPEGKKWYAIYTKDGSVDGDWGDKVTSSTKLNELVVNFYIRYISAATVKFYNGETVVSEVAEKYEMDTLGAANIPAAPTEGVPEGKIFGGWYTKDAAGNFVTEAVGSYQLGVENNFYAKWIDECSFVGSYVGIEVWGTDSKSSSSATVNADWTMTGHRSGGTIKEYNEVTGSFVLVNGSSRYNGYRDVATGAFAINYATGAGLGSDTYYYFPLTGSIVFSSSVNFDSNTTRVLTLQNGDNSFVVVLRNGKIYYNVTVVATDLSGAVVDDVKNAKIVTVKRGEDVLTAFGIDGTTTTDDVKLTDGYEGEYALSGDEVKFVLDGRGAYTHGTESGTYTVSGSTIALSGGATYIIDNDAKTFTALSSNPFATKVFTGQYKDEIMSDDEGTYYNRMKISFDVTGITGRIIVNGYDTIWFDFTATVSGNEITFNFTDSFDDAANGKYLKGTISGKDINFTACDISNKAYRFHSSGRVTCTTDFSLGE